MRLLARREHSKRELLQKMALRQIAAAPSRVVIDELAEEGLQSDLRFAECYSRVRMQKGFGPTRIRYELRERGIDEFDLDALLEEMGEAWMALLQKVYENKYGGKFTGDFKAFAKQSRFLQHRGFTSEQIKMLFKMLNSEN
jgi:regulatory protein